VPNIESFRWSAACARLAISGECVRRWSSSQTFEIAVSKAVIAYKEKRGRS